jgi:hypothetical protein
VKRWWNRVTRTGILAGPRRTLLVAEAQAVLRRPLVEILAERLDAAGPDADPRERDVRRARRMLRPHLGRVERLLATALSREDDDWPHRDEATWTRARCLYHLGRDEETVAFVRATYPGRIDPPGIEYVALALRRLGRDAEAARMVDRALEGSPWPGAATLERLRDLLRGEPAGPVSGDGAWSGGFAHLGRQVGCGLVLAAPLAALAWFLSGKSVLLGRAFLAIGGAILLLYVVARVGWQVERRRLLARLA